MVRSSVPEISPSLVCAMNSHQEKTRGSRAVPAEGEPQPALEVVRISVESMPRTGANQWSRTPSVITVTRPLDGVGTDWSRASALPSFLFASAKPCAVDSGVSAHSNSEDERAQSWAIARAAASAPFAFPAALPVNWRTGVQKGAGTHVWNLSELGKCFLILW